MGPPGRRRPVHQVRPADAWLCDVDQECLETHRQPGRLIEPARSLAVHNGRQTARGGRRSVSREVLISDRARTGLGRQPARSDGNGANTRCGRTDTGGMLRRSQVQRAPQLAHVWVPGGTSVSAHSGAPAVGVRARRPVCVDLLTHSRLTDAPVLLLMLDEEVLYGSCGSPTAPASRAAGGTCDQSRVIAPAARRHQE